MKEKEEKWGGGMKNPLKVFVGPLLVVFSWAYCYRTANAYVLFSTLKVLFLFLWMRINEYH